VKITLCNETDTIFCKTDEYMKSNGLVL